MDEDFRMRMQRMVVPNKRDRRETNRPPPQVPTQRRAISRPLKLKEAYERRDSCNCGEGGERCIQAIEREEPEKWIQI
eukprot:4389293-Karenia_brevis.AAC.1